VPVALVARLVSGGDEVGSGWNAAFTVLIIGATLVGSGFAGRRQAELPMLHGAVAGTLTYAVARTVSVIASGDVPNAIALAFALIVFAGIGAIGGFVGAALLRRSGDGSRR
jgi:putative membrane protein (TIGR04086 family)